MGRERYAKLLRDYPDLTIVRTLVSSHSALRAQHEGLLEQLAAGGAEPLTVEKLRKTSPMIIPPQQLGTLEDGTPVRGDERRKEAHNH